METLQLIQRKDGTPMTEEDETSLLPYASMIHMFADLLTCAESISTLDKVQRKDCYTMTEEDEVALLPYSGLILLFSLVSSKYANDFSLYEEDVFGDFEFVERKDGSPMTEDDENALLPYSGFISLYSMMSTDLELDESPTGHFDESDDDEVALDICRGITRKDGTPMTDDDKSLLMDYGALVLFLKSFIALRDGITTDPLLNVQRLDGTELDADDDAVLMEYYPIFNFLQNAYDSMCTPLAVVFYPDGDEDFAEFGEKMGTKLPTAISDDTEMSYSAWSLVGRGLLAVYHKTFGSFSSPWEAKSQTSGLKRKPSGAELSAWIGLAAQGAFGLDDPSRRIRARAVL